MTRSFGGSSMPDQLLPPNATPLERALEQAMAVYGDAGRDVPVADVWRPATCLPALLPWLAWALSVRGWDAAWPVEVQRRAVAGAWEGHRRAGTHAGVVDLLDEYDAEYSITSPGPYLIRIEISNSAALTAPETGRMRDQIERAKRLSVHTTMVLTGTGLAGRLGLAAGSRRFVVGAALEAG